MFRFGISAALVSLVLASPQLALGQGRPDPAALTAAQQGAMSRLAGLDGVWRGSAWTEMRPGEKHTVTQTERVGSFLGGTIKVIEGRGYEADGSVAFNALGIISFDSQTDSYSIRSYAQGRVGDFPVTVTDDGFQWEIEAGPVKIQYAAVIQDDTWTETGDRIMPNGETVRFFEMTLTRVGDTDWPAGNPVPPK